MTGRVKGVAGWLTPRNRLIVAVLVAATLRALWARAHGLAIEHEGVEYARLAENLLAGRGYVGIFNDGPQLNFPPLYPIVIAGLSLVVGSTELAARMINVVLGALLVLPVSHIAWRLYGQRVATMAAVLVVFHPVLIAGSASTFSEGPYLTLLLWGVLWTMRWLTGRSLRAAAVGGGFFGLAYLVRPEVFLFVGAFAAVGLGAALVAPAWRRLAGGAAVLTAVFAVLAAPYVIFLGVHTGHLRLEGKGTIAYAWGMRVNQGMSYGQAAYGIGPDLSEQGVFMRPNAEVITSTRLRLAEYLHFMLRAARRNQREIVQKISAGATIGSPWLFALVILGLFGSPWDRGRLSQEAILVLTGLILLLLLLTLQALWFRYFYGLIGVLLVWSAKGADQIATWTRRTWEALGPGGRRSLLAGDLAAAGSMILVLGWSARALPSEPLYAESLNWERARAGRWLAHQDAKPTWVMDQGLQVAYYAGANLIFLPYADSALALRYVAKRDPDYIVLLGRAKAGLPYTTRWFDRGIPDPRAHLVYDEGKGTEEEIKIYRWMDPSYAGQGTAPPLKAMGDTAAASPRGGSPGLGPD